MGSKEVGARGSPHLLSWRRRSYLYQAKREVGVIPEEGEGQWCGEEEGMADSQNGRGGQCWGADEWLEAGSRRKAGGSVRRRGRS
jgi:hypothetical protein